MKIIHCADLHLDSKMTANLTREQARERRKEIIRTFTRMVEYAETQDVRAILIAGDLFDTKKVSATAGNIVSDGDIRIGIGCVIIGNITASTITVLDGATIQGYVNTTFLQENSSNIFPESISVNE